MNKVFTLIEKKWNDRINKDINLSKLKKYTFLKNCRKKITEMTKLTYNFLNAVKMR